MILPRDQRVGRTRVVAYVTPPPPDTARGKGSSLSDELLPARGSAPLQQTVSDQIGRSGAVAGGRAAGWKSGLSASTRRRPSGCEPIAGRSRPRRGVNGGTGVGS